MKSGTGQVQGVVQAGQTATDKDYNANQQKLEGVSKTASVDGKTSEAVIATAGSNVDAGGKKVSAKATNVGYDGNAVKNSVVEKGEKASKPGGLGEMANNGTEDAVDQIVDQVSKAVLEPLAGDLKKSMGYPPAPPPPPAPAPPYKSWK